MERGVYWLNKKKPMYIICTNLGCALWCFFLPKHAQNIYLSILYFPNLYRMLLVLCVCLVHIFCPCALTVHLQLIFVLLLATIFEEGCSLKTVRRNQTKNKKPAAHVILPALLVRACYTYYSHCCQYSIMVLLLVSRV